MEYLIQYVPRRWPVTSVLFNLLGVDDKWELRVSAEQGVDENLNPTDDPAIERFLRLICDVRKAELFKKIA